MLQPHRQQLMLLSVKKVFSLLQLWVIFSSALINNLDCFFFCLWVNKQKYEQRYSAITTHIVVKGGTALVYVQPESQLQRLFYLVDF